MYFTFSVARHLIFSSTKKRNTSFGFSELRQFLYGKESGWGSLGSQGMEWGPKRVLGGQRGRGGEGRLPLRARRCKGRVEAFPNYARPPRFWPGTAPWDCVGVLSISSKYPHSIFFGCIFHEAANPLRVRLSAWLSYSPWVQWLPQGRCSACRLPSTGVGLGWADEARRGRGRGSEVQVDGGV